MNRPSSTVSQDRVLPARELSASGPKGKGLEYKSSFANTHFGTIPDRRLPSAFEKKLGSANKNYSSDGKSAKSPSKSPMRKTLKANAPPKPLAMSTQSMSKTLGSRA